MKNEFPSLCSQRPAKSQIQSWNQASDHKVNNRTSQLSVSSPTASTYKDFGTWGGSPVHYKPQKVRLVVVKTPDGTADTGKGGVGGRNAAQNLVRKLVLYSFHYV